MLEIYFELQRVIDLTSNLKNYFSEKTPKIVCYIGGYTRDLKANDKQKEEMIERLTLNFKKLDRKIQLF